MATKKKKDALVLKETYHPDTYVPAKSDLIKLIKKGEVRIYITARSKYESGEEHMDVKIIHA